MFGDSPLLRLNDILFLQDLIRHYQENTMSTSFLGLETTLKIPYRDPNFFPSASGPPPLPTPRPVRPSPPDFNRSSRNHHIDQVVNGVRQISMSCRTILIMFYLCVPSYHHDAFFCECAVLRNELQCKNSLLFSDAQYHLVSYWSLCIFSAFSFLVETLLRLH